MYMFGLSGRESFMDTLLILVWFYGVLWLFLVWLLAVCFDWFAMDICYGVIL